jgi:hypothetical protein
MTQHKGYIMKLLMRGFSFIVLFTCLGMISTQALAMNAKLGMWEWTTTIDLPGTPIGLPPIIYRSCISAKKLAPKPPNSENCKITSHTIEADRVDWTMECSAKKNTYIHTGHMNYNDTAAMGESSASSTGSAISSMILGSYIRSCR